jgi:2-polyprenyl-3-methyl-5-hydroxy-6-metoxy-1,4-benzoquinol methylase
MSNNNINYHDDKINFFIKRTNGKNVLDLGVVQHSNDKHDDPNWLHRAIFNNSKSCLGLDIDKDGVDFLREKGFNVVHADAQNFDSLGNFDLSTAGDIIEHLSNVGGFLNSINNNLPDNGVLILSTPNPFWWKMGVLVAIKKHAPVHTQHTCWFCEQTLRQVLHRHGFRLTEVEYGSVYNINSTYHKITKYINKFLPLPSRFLHNTLLISAVKIPVN